MKTKKYKWAGWIGIVLAAGLLCIIVGRPITDSLYTDVAQQSSDAVKQAVLDSAIQCYAVEGAYPPNMTYLEENYGLLVDHAQYVISYECFASNVLPDVRVLSR